MWILDWLYDSSPPPRPANQRWLEDIKIVRESQEGSYFFKIRYILPDYLVSFLKGKDVNYAYDKSKIKFYNVDDSLICYVFVARWWPVNGVVSGEGTEYNIDFKNDTCRRVGKREYYCSGEEFVNPLIAKLKLDYKEINTFINKSIQHSSLYDEMKSKNNYGSYTKDMVQRMTWRGFEEFVELIFKSKGFKTCLTPATNDEGKDIIAIKDGITYYIECKHWNTNATIGREYLQKLVGAAISRCVTSVIFIATCEYNENAIQYAKQVNVGGIAHSELWNITKLLNVANSIKFKL